MRQTQIETARELEISLKAGELTWSGSGFKLELVGLQGSAILIPVKVIVFVFKGKHGCCCTL